MTIQKLNNRVALSNLVSNQLPEFVRAQYPTFVAFVEAYYEFLDKQNVDLAQIRDIDTTLDEFIQYFKSELAHNYPVSDSFDTERYLLKHVKDQYLAKGSEASYKLLFRLLYGKDVYLDYPGKQMLRISDGRWQQDVSLFVRVDLGDPISLIGKVIDIQTSRRLNIATAVSKVTANVENVIKVSDNIYELFLDRNFYGDIKPGDSVKYQSDFQGQILPCTAKVRVQRPGKNFKPGQVFQIQFGEGSALWFKVLTTTEDGGIEKVDIIRFGIGYETDFAMELLPTSAVTTQKKVTRSATAVTFEITSGVIGSINVLNGGSGYQFPPDVRFSDEGSGAVAHTVIENGKVVEIVVTDGGSNYNQQSFAVIVPKTGDLTGAGAKGEIVLGTNYAYDAVDKIEGFTEVGYGNWGDYWDLTESGRGAKAKAIVHNDVITKIKVTNPGQYYTNAIVTITDATGSGTSASANIHDGVIYGIDVINKGKDYTSATVVIDDVTGVGASASAVIVNGKITSIVMNDYGYNYTNPTITIDGDGTIEATATALVGDNMIPYVTINNYGFNFTNPTITITGDGIGATAVAIVEDGAVTNLSLTNGGTNYHYPSPYVDICHPLSFTGIPIGTGRKAKAIASVNEDGVIDGLIITDPGRGYNNITPPPVNITGAYGYANGAYVGSIARQFYVDAKDTISTNQSLLGVTLGAVAKYPGYYKTNDGFLNDAMFIQDSFYYQAFSYVIRIDEQLQSYAAVVRTMLHPSGMAMFGEYSINNKVNLSIALESLVKSLGVTLYDIVIVKDEYEVDENGFVVAGPKIKTSKELFSFNVVLDDNTVYDNLNRLLKGVAWSFVKSLDDTFTQSDTNSFKPFYDEKLGRVVNGIEKVFGAVGSAEKVFTYDDGSFKRFTKTVADSVVSGDSYFRKVFSKNNLDFQPIADQHALAFTLNTILDPLSGIYPEEGFVTLDPYDEGSFFMEQYANERLSSWSN